MNDVLCVLKTDAARHFYPLGIYPIRHPASQENNDFGYVFRGAQSTIWCFTQHILLDNFGDGIILIFRRVNQARCNDVDRDVFLSIYFDEGLRNVF